MFPKSSPTLALGKAVVLRMLALQHVEIFVLEPPNPQIPNLSGRRAWWEFCALPTPDKWTKSVYGRLGAEDTRLREDIDLLLDSNFAEPWTESMGFQCSALPSAPTLTWGSDEQARPILHATPTNPAKPAPPAPPESPEPGGLGGLCELGPGGDGLFELFLFLFSAFAFQQGPRRHLSIAPWVAHCLLPPFCCDWGSERCARARLLSLLDLLLSQRALLDVLSPSIAPQHSSADHVMFHLNHRGNISGTLRMVL